MAAGVVVDPLDLLVERSGDEVEDHRRRGDVVVVDGADPRRIPAFGETDVDGLGHLGNVARGRALLSFAVLQPTAPLAQLAEHFHGKEGVYGSSP